MITTAIGEFATALPGGGKLGVYQPRHVRPKPMTAPKPKSARKKTATKKR